MALQIRRGTELELSTFTPAEGELIFDKTNKKVYVGDGQTVGGIDVSIAGGIGGPLSSGINLNTYSITGVGDINITGSIAVSGTIAGDFEGALQGDVIGSVVGDVYGNLIGGSVIGSDSSVLVDSITNKITGDLTGNIVGINDNIVLDNTLQTSVFYGTVAGTVTGDVVGTLYGNVVSSDSSMLVNGDTKTLSNSIITIQDNTISSTDNFIFIKGVNDQTLAFEQRQGSPIINAKTLLNSNIGTPSKMNFIGYKTSFETPGTPVIGDYIGSITFSAYDPNSEEAPAGLISGGIDNNGSVSQGFVSGKLTMMTVGGTNESNVEFKFLTFDSKGQLAINQGNAQATLDVNGFAKLAVLSTEPVAPANGMIAIADGDSVDGWDPLSLGAPYKQQMVVRLGGAWRAIAQEP
jgi:hypothetical protein